MAQPHNSWCSPGKPLWSTEDDIVLKDFFKSSVSIDPVEWERNKVCVNTILPYIHEQLVKGEEDSDIKIQPFVRLGSAREGTKVRHADEFDVAMPFKFSDTSKAEVIESPVDSLPPGTAKVIFRDDVNDKFRKLDQNGQVCANAKYIHDEFFKSCLDKALVEVLDKELTLEEIISRTQNPKQACALRSMLRAKKVDGTSIGLTVTGRKSNQPALTINLEINDRSAKKSTVNIDCVPAYERNDERHRKFLVSKWVNDEQNKKLKESFLDPSLTWRISHTHLELGMFQKKGLTRGQQKRSRYLKSAYMTLKTLKEEDVQRKESSQFSNVVKSYHLKNIYMYFQHYENQGELKVTSTSQGLALFSLFLQNSLKEKNLPQFFSDPTIVRQYFPDQALPEGSRKLNLFKEMSDESLRQAELDFEQCLKHRGLSGIVDPFLKLNSLYKRDSLDSE